ncbi:MAG: hypothetical protein OQK24_12145 [Magnetovibrio sp.]|nr:hypothetical protein [Magnetovibrio sp.]
MSERPVQRKLAAILAADMVGFSRQMQADEVRTLSGVLGHAYRYAGRFDEALEILSDYNRQSPGFGLVDIILTYSYMGQGDKACQYIEALLEARPDFTVEAWTKTQNCIDPARLKRDQLALINAGLE